MTKKRIFVEVNIDLYVVLNSEKLTANEYVYEKF